MKSAALRAQLESALGDRFPSPFIFRERHAAETAPSGLVAIDSLTAAGGLPRGALTEIFGPSSSGRTSLLLSLLTQMTAREEVCALVDATDAFDPHSARAAGVDLRRLLWVRCNQVEQSLRVTDLLLQGGGFGLVAVDLSDVPPQVARRVPLACWFRFRRVVENTPTLLVVLEQSPYAKTCASFVLRLEPNTVYWSTAAGGFRSSKFENRNSEFGFLPDQALHTTLLRGARLNAEVVGARRRGKPPCSTAIDFETNTAL